MNSSLVLTLALMAGPTGDGAPSVYQPSPWFPAIIRGQTPPPSDLDFNGDTFDGEYSDQGEFEFGTPGTGEPELGDPLYPGENIPPGDYVDPGGTIPFSNGPMNYDPFLGTPAGPQIGPSPVFGGNPNMYSSGVNGPQPYRFGWHQRYDAGFLPKAEAQDPLGNLGIFEFDGAWQYTTPTAGGWIFAFTQEYGLRTFDGPTTPPTFPSPLPGAVHHIGWDFELSTPSEGPFSWQFGFNPSMNSDFEASLSSKAWNWDGRGALFFRSSPQLTWVGGVMYWDRVDDYFVPYAGLIWLPDDRWEWRLVFPEPRVSYFLGCHGGHAKWIYIRGEYHVEAYEIELETTKRREQVEFEDWRALLGLRSDNGAVSMFVEAGWVFGREVDFRGPTSGFDVSTGFITRAGLRY